MAKIITKVNSKGMKRKKLKCPKGYKISPSGNTCVPITGSEKTEKRLAIIKAVRTRRQGGVAKKRKTTRKRLKAMRFRKSFGL